MRIIGLLVLLAGTLVSTSLAETSEDFLDLGAAAFKQAHYAEAVQHFQDAVNADPSNIAAHLYLATAFQMQCIPGVNTPENQDFAEQATKEYHKVLSLDPRNGMALASLASLAYNRKDFDQAEKWNKEVLRMDPNNKEAYYTLGVLAWTRWLPVDRQARIDSNQKPDDPGPIGHADIRSSLKAKWLPILDEGIRDEQAALRIDSQYNDAMTYMNLLVRYRADLLDTQEEYKSESQLADMWMNRALEAKRTKSLALPQDAANPLEPAAPGTLPAAQNDRSRLIRVGGAVAQASLLSQVSPVYPLLAKRARISGSVKFNVRIDKGGRVQNVTLISGHPLLVQAAMDAVSQWVYKPTLLNGNPVEVLTTVDVTFNLEP